MKEKRIVLYYKPAIITEYSKIFLISHKFDGKGVSSGNWFAAAEKNGRNHILQSRILNEIIVNILVGHFKYRWNHKI